MRICKGVGLSKMHDLVKFLLWLTLIEKSILLFIILLCLWGMSLAFSRPHGSGKWKLAFCFGCFAGTSLLVILQQLWLTSFETRDPWVVVVVAKGCIAVSASTLMWVGLVFGVSRFRSRVGVPTVLAKREEE